MPFLRLPSTGKASRCLKLAWSSEGLYGAIVAEQTGIYTDPGLPWNGDSLEIDLESDARGRTRTASVGVPAKVFLWPRGGDDGNVGLLRSVGSLPRDGVRVAWRRSRLAPGDGPDAGAKAAVRPGAPAGDGLQILRAPA